MYVGLKSCNLAFVVPNGKDSRKKTVDKWRDNDIEPLIIKNECIDGFKIDSVNNRYSNSNKVFRVIHPLGFIFEIDSYNLQEIIENATIEKSVIKDKCYLMINSNKVILKLNSLIKHPIKEVNCVEENVYYRTSNNTCTKFIGVFYRTYVGYSNTILDNFLISCERCYSKYNYPPITEPSISLYKKRVEKCYLYQNYKFDDDYNITEISLERRTSHKTDVSLVCEFNATDEILNSNINLDELSFISPLFDKYTCGVSKINGFEVRVQIDINNVIAESYSHEKNKACEFIYDKITKLLLNTNIEKLHDIPTFVDTTRKFKKCDITIM